MFNLCKENRNFARGELQPLLFLAFFESGPKEQELAFQVFLSSNCSSRLGQGRPWKGVTFVKGEIR